MLNHATIMGRLTAAPALRYTQNNTPVAAFTVAVDRDFTGKDGGEKQTDFINCVAWRHTAEFISKYFGKGDMAVVSGRIQVRFYEDKHGNNRSAVELVAENVYFGAAKRTGAAAAADTDGTAQEASGTAFHEISGEDDGDLPF